MTATAQACWREQEDDPQVCIDGRVRPELEDAYWQSVYWAQPHFRAGYCYEDYAPAYCVGYIGYAQYGGSFDEAEKSLCANWLRIKGDSRLDLQEALQAIRAAWDHAAIAPLPEEQEEGEELVPEELLAGRGAPARRPAYATA